VPRCLRPCLESVERAGLLNVWLGIDRLSRLKSSNCIVLIDARKILEHTPLTAKKPMRLCNGVCSRSCIAVLEREGLAYEGLYTFRFPVVARISNLSNLLAPRERAVTEQLLRGNTDETTRMCLRRMRVQRDGRRCHGHVVLYCDGYHTCTHPNGGRLVNHHVGGSVRRVERLLTQSYIVWKTSGSRHPWRPWTLEVT